MSESLQKARARLQSLLSGYGRLLVAYSGGVDSAYLAWEAHEVLGERMVAVLADSPSLPRTHLAQARAFAAEHSIPLRVIHTAEMERPEYLRNDGSRCFFCKDELFRGMEAFRDREHPGAPLAYGRNLDDAGDFRPGQRAAAEHGAVAPLAEAGLGKSFIRALAQAAGLSVWDKPAAACLASRLEYGRPVTAEALAAVERAEENLRALGYKQLRVRHHGELARVELEESELHATLSTAMLAAITTAVRAAGFKLVALDTEGYRSGSMNVLLPVGSLLAAGHAS